MCEMNDSLDSNKRPKYLNSGTTSVFTPSNISSGSKCNFLDCQKCMHLVFVSENLKPFSLDHLL